MVMSERAFRSRAEPAARDVVIVCDAASVHLQIPEASPARVACRSYDEALSWGLSLARARNVDLWAVEGHVTTLIARRRETA
jgi:hypothetical protein